MNKALVIGGSNGIGLAVGLRLSKLCQKVIFVDKNIPSIDLPSNIEFNKINLLNTDFKWLDKYKEIDILFYSAGFGRVAEFHSITFKEIENLFLINTISAFKILHFYINRIKEINPFYCGVMVSISGRIASPLFSIYSATKAALFRGIEAINTELEMSGTNNRILEISPGSIHGTSFNGQRTDLKELEPLADKIIKNLFDRKEVFIPDFDEVFDKVIKRYNIDPKKFSKESYLYKKENGRIQNKPQVVIGYLSGTFDLFHIGHLNLLKRAKEYCDYLVVGVHKDASHKGKECFIPYEERIEIIKNIKYVDEVIESEKEDWDIYKKGILKFNRLFVGSDYKGSERFKRYEEYFKDKDVEIIYFPYTKTTSSTQLRDKINNK